MIDLAYTMIRRLADALNRLAEWIDRNGKVGP